MTMAVNEKPPLAEYLISTAQSFSSYLHDRTTVRSGAEMSLGLSVSQGASIGDFLLALVCPITKVTLGRVSFI